MKLKTALSTLVLLSGISLAAPQPAWSYLNYVERPYDPQTALQLLSRRSAGNDLLLAQCLVACPGFPDDPKRVWSLLRRNPKDKSARAFMGFLHYQGYGTQRDLEKARSIWKGLKGSALALYFEAYDLHQQHLPPEVVIPALLRASEAGVVQADVLLAEHYKAVRNDRKFQRHLERLKRNHHPQGYLLGLGDPMKPLECSADDVMVLSWGRHPEGAAVRFARDGDIPSVNLALQGNAWAMWYIAEKNWRNILGKVKPDVQRALMNTGVMARKPTAPATGSQLVFEKRLLRYGRKLDFFLMFTSQRR